MGRYMHDSTENHPPMEAEKGTPKLRRTRTEHGSYFRCFAEVTSEASPMLHRTCSYASPKSLPKLRRSIEYGRSHLRRFADTSANSQYTASVRPSLGNFHSRVSSPIQIEAWISFYLACRNSLSLRLERRLTKSFNSFLCGASVPIRDLIRLGKTVCWRSSLDLSWSSFLISGTKEFFSPPELSSSLL